VNFEIPRTDAQVANLEFLYNEILTRLKRLEGKLEKVEAVLESDLESLRMEDEGE